MVMLDWDNSFRGLVRKNQLTLHLYRRFVDDNFNGMEALPAGLRWMEEEQRMMLNLDLVEEDKSIPEHEGTVRAIQGPPIGFRSAATSLPTL